MTLIAEHIEGDTRDRILEVAERLFRQIGYQKTTFGDIARSCAERYPQGRSQRIRLTVLRFVEPQRDLPKPPAIPTDDKDGIAKRHRLRARLRSGIGGTASAWNPATRLFADAARRTASVFRSPYHQRLQAPRNRPRLTAESAG